VLLFAIAISEYSFRIKDDWYHLMVPAAAMESGHPLIFALTIPAWPDR